MAAFIREHKLNWTLKGKAMTNEINVLHFDSIITELKATNVKQVFQTLSTHVSRLIGTPEKFILESLINSEKQENSGIGHGVAISHMRLPRLTRPMIVYAKLLSIVDFQSSDGEPVDLVCLILSPEFEGSKHLQRLAKVTRFFNDKNFCAELRAAEDKDDIRLTLKEMNNRKLAA
jgi:PTS system nitrogen regulatory IIA component